MTGGGSPRLYKGPNAAFTHAEGSRGFWAHSGRMAHLAPAKLPSALGGQLSHVSHSSYSNDHDTSPAHFIDIKPGILTTT